MNADYGCMLALVMGDDQHGNHMTNAVGASVRIQSNYAKVRETVKETWNCVVGSVISNKIPVFLPCEKMKIEYEERIEMIDVCRELARKLRRITDISFRVGIGSIRRLNESMASYEEALKALVNSTGSVAHVDDLPIQCRYDKEYPIDLENELFARLRSGEREECEREAAHFFDWMLENYGENNMSVKLKTLEFVLWAEHIVYQDGGMTYHFQDRSNYLPLVMNAEKNSDLKNWFVGKFGEACRNMHTKKEEHANQMVIRAEQYIRENYHRDLSLDEVSRQLDLSPYYFSKLFKEETRQQFRRICDRLKNQPGKGNAEPEGVQHEGNLCGGGVQRPQLFQPDFQEKHRRHTDRIPGRSKGTETCGKSIVCLRCCWLAAFWPMRGGAGTAGRNRTG